MVNCSAFGCTNRSSNHPELSFHIVPSEKRGKSIRKQCLHNIRGVGDLPKDNSFVFAQPISKNTVLNMIYRYINFNILVIIIGKSYEIRLRS